MCVTLPGTYDFLIYGRSWSHISIYSTRDEKSHLMVGVRRANRQQTTLPSSVLSADSMHIGVLAAAAHAAANRSSFTIFYNPRFTNMKSFTYLRFLYFFSHVSGFWITSWPSHYFILFVGHVLQNLSSLCQDSVNLSLGRNSLLAWGLAWCLKQRSPVSGGNFPND